MIKAFYSLNPMGKSFVLILLLALELLILGTADAEPPHGDTVEVRASAGR